MMRTAFIGGHVASFCLRKIGRGGEEPHGSGNAYANRSKLEVVLGPDIWARLAGKIVVDFGCGVGAEAIEIARRGADRVIGIDIRDRVLEMAREAAARAGVADRCLFTTSTDHSADVVISIDGFEHYEEPEKVLDTMLAMLSPGGEILIAFGPPWFHPYGGHLFSVFPWAHLIFTEKALIRWRSDFKSDGATGFCEVEGGLNQMTVHRFRRLVQRRDLLVKGLRAVPIQRLRLLHNRVTEEAFTSIVRCQLAMAPSFQAPGALTAGARSVDAVGTRA